MLSRELTIEIIWNLLDDLSTFKLNCLHYYPPQELGKRAIIELIGYDGWNKIENTFRQLHKSGDGKHNFLRSVISKEQIGEWYDECVQVS